MKWCRVSVVKTSSIRDFTNGTKVNLSPNMMWFKDDLGKSWWACSTLNKSHRNKRDPKVV